eukprot:TRINITY_DN15262_c0_g1_i1.p1 TRINITY_DN15262_c0_g1~~TRINITY_DN15262_c0_g1_i1.p1  ORF type:complete len:867 (-),score=206.79 TRINITY_DN15262_c0_g1_i1:80-2680(-)
MEHPHIASEDVVCLHSNPKALGVVSRVAWDTEDYSDSSDEEDKLEKDEVLVEWFFNRKGETVHKPHQIKVLDRAFLTGDIVIDPRDPKSQSGTVIQIHMKLELLLPKNVYIRGVPGEKVQAVNPYIEGKFVVLGEWVGTIQKVYFDVEVQFSSGLCKIVRADTNKINPEGLDRDPDDPDTDVFFPGQKVTGRAKPLRKSQWISGGLNEKDMKGVVVSMVPSDVQVDWVICSGKVLPKPPHRTVKASTLTVLNYFHYAELQINDNIIISQSDKDHYMSIGKQNQNHNNNNNQSNKQNGQTEAAQNANDQTQGQNQNRRKRRNKSKSQPLFTNLGDATDKATKSEKLEPFKKVVARITKTETYIDVLWQDGTVSRHVNSIEVMPYAHPLDNEFWPEDVVYSSNKELYPHVGVVRRFDSSARTATISWILEDNSRKEEEVSSYSLYQSEAVDLSIGDVVMRYKSDECDDPSVPWVGQIIAMNNGIVSVWWHNGTISDAPFDKLVRLCEDEDESSESEVEEVEEEEVREEEEEEDGECLSADAEDVEDGEPHENESKVDSAREEDPQKTLDKNADRNNNNNNNDNNVGSTVPINMYSTRYKVDTFEVLEDFADHRFATDITPPLNARSFSARILREWDMLKKNLSDGVFVRVSENRLDLVRVLIIGPEGTPYYESVFVIDFKLPPNYPKEPPVAHYWNPINQRFNPNLYENGRICLSLLGTWSGRGVEIWDPSSSNLLQVVLSIQGLILGTPEPYYLEAGYDKQKGLKLASKASVFYNENAFLMSIQSAARTILCPNQHFEGLIRAHFKERGEFLLNICHLFLNRGPLLASAIDEDPCLKLFSVPKQSSEGFCQSLELIATKLQEALTTL